MRAQTKIQDSSLFHKRKITFIFTQPRHQHTTCGTRINAVDEHTTKYNLEHTNLEPRPMHPLMINRFRSSVSDRIGFYVCFLCTYTRKSVLANYIWLDYCVCSERHRIYLATTNTKTDNWNEMKYVGTYDIGNILYTHTHCSIHTLLFFCLEPRAFFDVYFGFDWLTPVFE